MIRRTLVCAAAFFALTACGRRQVQTSTPTAGTPQSAISIASGTDLLVRIVEPIDVTQALEGKAWAAVVSRDVRTPAGDLLIGAGSPLYLGVISTNGKLQLIIQSVVASGNSYLSRVPVVSSGPSVTGLEPWGTAAVPADVRLEGERIFVPGQALVALKLSELLTLR